MHSLMYVVICRGMFAGGLKEMEQEEVLIHGVSYNAMCQILHFIYTSELELSLSNVQETLVAACQLQIPEIIHFCCDFLTPWVDEDNILDVYRLAELFDLSRLTEQLDAYILKNFVAFSRTDKYRQLPLEKVYALLSSNRLEVSCETEVYEGALLYHYPPEQVQADRLPLHEPPKLLETVRFPLMEAEVLQRLHDKLEPSPLRDTVAEALMYHRNESLQPSLQGPQTELRSDFQCVVGFGGIHSTPSTVLSDQAKYLNPLLGEWKHFTASLAPRMSNQGIAVLNNFVYLIGGDNNVQGFRAESRCWRYDPRHNRWFQIQPLQQEHADLCVCVVGGYIYAVAGRDYHNDLTAVERYDPATNSWAYVAPLKREVYAHAGAALDGKMYVTCGRRGEDYLKETHCYEPGSDTWHTLADGPVRRAWHGMATLLDKLYVIGGSNNDAGYRRDVHQGRPTPPSGCAESIRPLTLGLAKWWPFQLPDQGLNLGPRQGKCESLPLDRRVLPKRVLVVIMTQWPATAADPGSGPPSAHSRPGMGSRASLCSTAGSMCWAAAHTTAAAARAMCTSTTQAGTAGRRGRSWTTPSQAWPPACSPCRGPCCSSPPGGPLTAARPTQTSRPR
ncbi:kelch-like protein 22 isoform X5 [Bos indicus]|uniref:Kelch-like protein 22 n=1 Tax=Bos indicus TaxID=9915 RepID=A0ABM4QS52_BOSIN